MKRLGIEVGDKEYLTGPVLFRRIYVPKTHRSTGRSFATESYANVKI